MTAHDSLPSPPRGFSRDEAEPFVVRLKRNCRTCQHWNDTMYGECLKRDGPRQREHTNPTDTCAGWQAGAWTKPDRRIACSICGAKVETHGWGVDAAPDRPWLKAEKRIPLCDRCGHCIWAGETAWYKRVGIDDTPREMLGLMRKVKECYGFLRRAADGHMNNYPYQGEPACRGPRSPS